MSDINLVDVELTWKVGHDHSAEIKTKVPEGTEIVYFTAGFAGWAEGMSAASGFLTDLLPDPSDLPAGSNLLFQALAGKASKQVRGG